jgi:alpha-glucoside transport system permease protein
MTIDRLLQATVAVVFVPLVTAGYIVLAERVLGVLPPYNRGRVRPWLWLAPAGSLLAVFLVYPSLSTIWRSLFDATGARFVGLANYQYVFTDPGTLTAIRNNVLWVAVFTLATLLLGLLIAVLTDRVSYEPLAKGVVFLPMAISFVAAGVIWKFMYDFRPPELPQIGILNALLMAILPGYTPHPWLIEPQPWNNLALIAAATWTWTGFCMVILSAGLKGIPTELIEAARVDGASELQVFRMVILPLLAPTMAVVATTMVIFALKAFDIVYVMTNGNYGTDVLANQMYKVMFNARDFGRASAIAVVLLLAIVPVMLLNVSRFRQQEDIR